MMQFDFWLSNHYGINQEEFTALKSTRDGDKVMMPQTTIRNAHEEVQKHINYVDLANRVRVPVFNAFAVASAFIPYAGIVLAPTISAIVGGAARESFGIWDEMDKHRKAIDSVNTRIRELAKYFAEVNLVNELDSRVRAGKTVSYEELGKLVNMHEDKFKDACHSLAITVLQARAVLMQHTHKINPYQISTFENLDFNQVASALSRLSSKQGQALRLMLLDELKNAEILPQSDDNPQAESTAAHSKPKENLAILDAILSFYKDGIADNWLMFKNKPKSTDFLPEVPNDFVVTLNGTDQLENMITEYNQHFAENERKRRRILDLPALQMV